jgi:hypothetical protein
MRTEEENKLPENIQQHLIKLESKTKINNDELSQIRKDVQAASDRMIGLVVDMDLSTCSLNFTNTLESK